jgi:hypothetical protein
MKSFSELENASLKCLSVVSLLRSCGRGPPGAVRKSTEAHGVRIDPVRPLTRGTAGRLAPMDGGTIASWQINCLRQALGIKPP